MRRDPLTNKKELKGREKKRKRGNRENEFCIVQGKHEETAYSRSLAIDCMREVHQRKNEDVSPLLFYFYPISFYFHLF